MRVPMLKHEITIKRGDVQNYCLYEGDRRVKAREITRSIGVRGHRRCNFWLVHEDEVDLIKRIRRERCEEHLRGKVFVPSNPRSRIHKALGLSVRTELALEDGEE